MPTSCVYLLYNSAGFCYVGQTTNLQKRLREHRRNLELDGRCSSKLLGPCWECEILEELDAGDLPDAEKFYYKFWSELCPGMIVNRQNPGRTGLEYAMEHRAENKERSKNYYSENRDLVLTKQKKYDDQRREQKNDRQQLYHAQNRDKINAKNKLRYAENRDERLAYQKLYDAQKKQLSN